MIDVNVAISPDSSLACSVRTAPSRTPSPRPPGIRLTSAGCDDVLGGGLHESS